MAAHPPSSASIPRSLALARVRSICMALPEAFEKVAWGEPTWRAGEKGKMFAQPTDQARALTVPSDAMEQALLIDAEPEVFFVPPYSGAGGWVGIRLDADTDWEQVAELLVGAYRRVAAPRPPAGGGAGRSPRPGPGPPPAAPLPEGPQRAGARPHP
ncbi:MAG TPA: MmcQ/YjbR family DNA-binding protein, partial [Tepidiformaceae bacterium]|nr:MmcQ/YjbR family DNA-binding protein [Tepidiformaceae bacterium]